MNSLVSLTVPLILFLNLFSPSQTAPKSSHSLCDIHTSIINCYGRSINKGSLDQLKDQLSTHYRGMYFSELMLSATEVTKIGAGLFADVEFENVIISDNQLLEEVNETAFGVGISTNSSSTPTVRSLTVIGNPLLKGTALYRIAQRLAEVPSFAFISHQAENHKTGKPSPLKKIQLRNNRIKTVKSNAFHQLDSIEEIDLSRNKLKISLAHNSLTSASFEVDFIELNNSNNAQHLSLDLSHNAIEELKEAVFKPILSRNELLTLDLTGNKVTCHNTAWLSKEENSKLVHRIKGITC
ncbi:hypothetical protein TYRP_010314 [Tyrophagus putrescentiae]|nr:hypothetical protein TYRP_010314 [Tyrophagus putrescentiae]